MGIMGNGGRRPLRELYAFDTPTAKQAVSESEFQETHYICTFTKRIADAVREMVDATPDETETMAVAAVALMSSAGELIGLLGEYDRQLADRALELGLNRFDTKRKELV
jgi:hypothetical protein